MKVLGRTTTALVAILLAGSALEAQQPTPRIVFVNSQRIMAEAPGIAQARAKMEQEVERLQQQMAPLRTQYEKLVADFQQQQGMMTPEKRRESQQAIAAKQQEIQQKGAELEQQAGAKQEELLAPELERINTVIDQVRQEKGYSFILDVAGGGVVAADPSLDITEEVLGRLQALATQSP